jgi:hypothetical protein
MDTTVVSYAPDLAAPAADLDAVAGACRDYAEGWYDADVERMARCLHPDLVKRNLVYDPASERWLLSPSHNAADMITLTSDGGGSQLPEGQRLFDVVIDSVFRDIASAHILSPEYMDYLQLARFGDRWLLVNVLWQLREGQLAPS